MFPSELAAETCRSYTLDDNACIKLIFFFFGMRISANPNVIRDQDNNLFWSMMLPTATANKRDLLGHFGVKSIIVDKIGLLDIQTMKGVILLGCHLGILRMIDYWQFVIVWLNDELTIAAFGDKRMDGWTFSIMTKLVFKMFYWWWWLPNIRDGFLVAPSS